MESSFSNGSRREPGNVCLPPLDYQMWGKPSLRVAYRDMVPMTRLFPTQLPLLRGTEGILPTPFRGRTSPWACILRTETLSKWKGMPPPRITIILWGRGVGCSSPIRSQPTAIFGWLIPTLGSSALGWVTGLPPMPKSFPKLGSIQEVPE